MPQGVPTPTAKVIEFKIKFLELGNARGAARAVGIPEPTGIKLARRLESSTEFIQERSELYARATVEADALMMGTMRTAYDRYHDDLPEPPEDARGTVVIQDARPQYGRLVVDGHKALTANQKIKAQAQAQAVQAAAEGEPALIIDRLNEDEPQP